MSLKKELEYTKIFDFAHPQTPFFVLLKQKQTCRIYKTIISLHTII